MSDTKYIVGIDFDVGDLKSKVDRELGRLPGGGASGGGNPKVMTDASGRVGALTGKLEALSRSAAGAVGRVADAFEGAVEKAGGLAVTLGTLGAGAILGGAIYGVTSLNSEVEKTKIGIADILTSGGDTSTLVEGMGKASGLMAQIRKDAAALPGETQDLARIFKLASIPGLKAGATTDRIESLSANAMAFGMGVANLDSGTVSRELAMLLQGRAGAHNVLGLQLGIGGGGEAKAFNAKSGEARFKEVETLLAKHKGSIDLFGESYEGLSSSLRDNAKSFTMMATAPLFESVKRTLKEANTWFAENPATIETWANLIGHRLQDSFEWGKRKVLEWEPAVEAFVSGAYGKLQVLWGKVGPLFTAAASALKDALADGSALDKIETILKLYAAAKLGGFVAPMAGGLAQGVMGAGKGVAGLFGQMGGAAGMAEGGAGAAGLAGAGAALPVAIGAAGALAIMAVATAGALDDLTDSTSRYHEASVKVAKVIQGDEIDALGALKGSLEALKPDAQLLADEMGIRLLGGLKMAADGAANAAGWMEHFARMVGAGDWEGVGRENRDKITTKARSGKVLEYAFEPDTLVDPKTKKARDAKVAPAVGVQNNYFTISGNQEPSRIARTVMNAVAEKSRHPISSGWLPNYSRGARI